jgi:ferredoxin
VADIKKRLRTNVAGDFYVDESCIDCATCRWMAPEVFDEAEGASRVHCQPGDGASRLRALQALIACPTASIGTHEKAADMAEAVASFPRRFGPEDLPVYHCGFHAESSFGAASYLIQRPEGNVLIDSPRFSEPLAKSLEALGGVAMMLLTHRDDVADHARFAERFGCQRVMHAADVSSGTRGIEMVIAGEAAISLASDLEAIPCPGHTRGSVCYLLMNLDERRLNTTIYGSKPSA